MAAQNRTVIKMPALGRSFDLGYLYDATNDKFTGKCFESLNPLTVLTGLLYAL